MINGICHLALPPLTNNMRRKNENHARKKLTLLPDATVLIFPEQFPRFFYENNKLQMEHYTP